MFWTYGENGRGLVGEENSRIQCEMCEVDRKAMKGMELSERIVYVCAWVSSLGYSF